MKGLSMLMNSPAFFTQKFVCSADLASGAIGSYCILLMATAPPMYKASKQTKIEVVYMVRRERESVTGIYAQTVQVFNHV